MRNIGLICALTEGGRGRETKLKAKQAGEGGLTWGLGEGSENRLDILVLRGYPLDSRVMRLPTSSFFTHMVRVEVTSLRWENLILRSSRLRCKAK